MNTTTITKERNRTLKATKSAELKTAKADTSANPESFNHEQYRDIDKGKVPLQVTRTLIVMVDPSRATPEYASTLRERLNVL
jgi:hypothetical protein